MAMEYYSFEKVLEELQMEEDELKRLVSEGEIRAFRDEDKMKFKKSDIDGLKKGRMTEPTIILPSSGGATGGADEEESEVLLVEDDTSETLLDIDDLDESDSGSSASSTSVPTIDFSEGSDDTGSETLTEELVFDDSSSELALDDSSSAATQDIGSEETFVDDSSTGMTTEPLDLMDDSEDSSSVARTVQVGGGTRKAPTAAPSRGRAPAAAPSRQMAPAMAPPPPPGSPAFTAILIFGFVFLFYGMFVMLNLHASRDTAVTVPATNMLGGLAPPKFVNDKRINPQGDGNNDTVTEGEKKWWQTWRNEPHYAISDKNKK